MFVIMLVCCGRMVVILVLAFGAYGLLCCFLMGMRFTILPIKITRSRS